MNRPAKPRRCHKGCGRYGAIPMQVVGPAGERIVYLCPECASKELPPSDT